MDNEACVQFGDQTCQLTIQYKKCGSIFQSQKRAKMKPESTFQYIRAKCAAPNKAVLSFKTTEVGIRLINAAYRPFRVNESKNSPR
jgi:hypothetical protein